MNLSFPRAGGPDRVSPLRGRFYGRPRALLRLAALEIFPQRGRETFAALSLFVRALGPGIHGFGPTTASWKALDRRVGMGGQV